MRPALFVRIPRTAGTSMWDALTASSTVAYQAWRLKDCQPLTDARLLTCLHAGIRSLVETRILPQADLDQRFVFTFVRNPWDRLLSLYLYFQQLARAYFFVGTFADFVDTIAAGLPTIGPYNYYRLSMANPQVAWLDLGGQREPEFIGRYERLDEDWPRLTSLLGIAPVALGHANQSIDRPPYAEVYDSRTRKIVASVYAEDIERFGYEFED